MLDKDKNFAESARETASNSDDILEANLCEATSVGDAEIDARSLDNKPNQALGDEEPEDKQGENESEPQKVGMKRKLKNQGKWKGIDPVILLKEESVINSIKAFYGIDDSFPLYGHLVTRNNDTDSVKRIYYISKSVKDVLELNILAGQQLKIASVGLKMFVSTSFLFPHSSFIIGAQS